MKILKNQYSKKIEDKINRIKWKSFTTNYEIVLYRAFGKTFNFISDLKHIGCFFHYLKIYLIEEGLNSNDNKKIMNI